MKIDEQKELKRIQFGSPFQSKRKLLLMIPGAGKTLEEIQAEVVKQLKSKGMMDDNGKIIIPIKNYENKNM